jgi:hypothetical protein
MQIFCKRGKLSMGGIENKDTPECKTCEYCIALPFLVCDNEKNSFIKIPGTMSGCEHFRKKENTSC